MARSGLQKKKKKKKKKTLRSDQQKNGLDQGCSKSGLEQAEEKIA